MKRRSSQGSSFGGGVALELIRRGVWSGPTLLLAPAQHAIAAKVGDDPKALYTNLSNTVPIHVIHGKPDNVIPFSNSEELVRYSPHIKLVAVEDGHALETALRSETSLTDCVIDVYNAKE